jgi:hypothetical protein
LSAANKENARPAARIVVEAKILSERIKASSFFFNEFEEHNKGAENYQQTESGLERENTHAGVAHS